MAKMQIPDELLDMVSGGTLSYRGMPATYTGISSSGMTFNAGGDSYTINFTDEMKGFLDKNPKTLGEMDSAFKQAQAHGDTVSIESAFMEMFGESV